MAAWVDASRLGRCEGISQDGDLDLVGWCGGVVFVLCDDPVAVVGMILSIHDSIQPLTSKQCTMSSEGSELEMQSIPCHITMSATAPHIY